MNTLIRLVLFAGALAPTLSAAQAADAPSEHAKGQVLLLRTQRILEGEIEHVEDQYRVKRPGGGETWIRAELVQRVCSSRESAYDYLRSQANLDDPDERLRLAKWCQVNNLREQAIAELRVAVAMRPEHAESRRLLNSWLEAVLTSPAPTPDTTDRPAPAPTKTTPALAHTSATPEVELNAELIGQFVRKVQPILMNTCFRCHGVGRGNPFELSRITGDGLASRRSSLQNLSAVLAQIKPEKPQASPLLVMAVSVHGGATQPPIRKRELPAYRCLEEWVQQAAADRSPSLPRTATTQAPAESPIHPEPPAAKPIVQPAPPQSDDKAPAQPVDEFDPVIFNRQMHPEKKDRY
jgi:hypothetical protein